MLPRSVLPVNAGGFGFLRLIALDDRPQNSVLVKVIEFHNGFFGNAMTKLVYVLLFRGKQLGLEL